MKSKRGNLKTILQVSFYLVLTLLAVYYILKDDPKKTFLALSQANFFPLIIAFFIVLFAMILLEGLCLKLLTNIFNRQYRYSQGIINTMIGGLVSVFAKTAAPLIQAYTFTKQKISLPHAASVLTMDFIIYQFTMIIYYTLIVILGYPTMNQVPVQILGDFPLVYIVYICLAAAFLYCLGAILLAYCRPLHRFVLNTGVNILVHLHIVKDPSKYRYRLANHLATYRIEMKRLSQHKGVVLRVLLINILKMFMMSLIPFFCFYALIPNHSSMTSDFFLKSLYGTGYIQIISNLLSVGVPEILFQDIFGYFLNSVPGTGSLTSLTSAANILWRITTFYFLFLVGLISYLCYRGDPIHPKILTDTSTIYDLSITNLDQEDPEIAQFLQSLQEQAALKNSPRTKLLSRKEIVSSFEEMRAQMQGSETQRENKDQPVDSQKDDIYQMTCSQLSNIVSETNEIIQSSASKEEIEQESRKDLQFQKRKSRIKAMKKTMKQKKRIQQKQAKELQRHQPRGAIVTFDEKTGIQIQPSTFIEMKTLTTSEEEKCEKPNSPKTNNKP